MRAVCLTLLVATVATGPACRSRAEPLEKPAQQKVVWRQLGSWSGHGDRQTESFTSDTGTLRVKWQTTPIPNANVKDPRFRLDAHSAISGRLLQPVAEQAGPGTGTGYVTQDPHVFYMVVESTGLDWTFTVEEGIGYP